MKSYDLSCTSADVEFHTTNEVTTIKDDGVTTYTQLAGKEREAPFHNLTSKGWFIVDDSAYAERFAKALRHAVELCDGQPSKF